MSPRSVRRLVLVVFVAGIGGMILGSIIDNNGVAITFGLVTATAALGLILVTMVTPAEAFHRPKGERSSDPDDAIASSRGHERGPSVEDDELAGASIEEQVERLMADGADEQDVRELVRRSIAYGRRSGRT